MPDNLWCRPPAARVSTILPEGSKKCDDMPFRLQVFRVLSSLKSMPKPRSRKRTTNDPVVRIHSANPNPRRSVPDDAARPRAKVAIQAKEGAEAAQTDGDWEVGNENSNTWISRCSSTKYQSTLKLQFQMMAV